MGGADTQEQSRIDISSTMDHSQWPSPPVQSGGAEL